MKRVFNFLVPVAFVAIFFASCSEDEVGPPIAEAFFEVSASDPYTISFSAQVENVNTYLWSFGDGETSSDATPSHTYEQSGDYEVILAVTGDGGEATDVLEVTIAASMTELLTGGPTATNGKTWVISTTATAGVDGAGKVANTYPADIIPGTDNLLTTLGLGAEYSDKYTFFNDGSYKITDGGNASFLTGFVFQVLNGLTQTTYTDYGIVSSKATNVTNATWSLAEDTDLTVEANNEDGTVDGVSDDQVSVTFSGVDYLTFSAGAWLGLRDFTTTAIIREISADRMVVSLFLHGNQDAMGYGMATNDYSLVMAKPSNILTITFDAE